MSFKKSTGCLICRRATDQGRYIYPYSSEGTHPVVINWDAFSCLYKFTMGSWQLYRQTATEVYTGRHQLYRQGKVVVVDDDGGPFASKRIYLLWQVWWIKVYRLVRAISVKTISKAMFVMAMLIDWAKSDFNFFIVISDTKNKRCCVKRYSDAEKPGKCIMNS